MQKKISTLVGVIIIVAVAIILFGSVFVYQYFAKPEAQNSNIETASWKTYINDEYGFEIKYPSDLIPKEYPVVENWNSFAFYDKNNKVFLTIDISKTTDIKNANWEKLDKIVIGGINGNRINTSPANNCYNLMVEKNNTTYILGDDCLDNQNLFNQIISTFKFTK